MGLNCVCRKRLARSRRIYNTDLEYSSSESELERKKRKAKKALEDWKAAAAGLLKSEQPLAKSELKPEPVPAPSNEPTEEDYIGKWRPMSLKVKLGRSSDEPEVEESRMVYMKDEKRGKFQPPPLQQQQQQQQQQQHEEEEELPPGTVFQLVNIEHEI